MGQYFKLVNPDREEHVELPGPMKAVERVTNPQAMAAVGYLLLEGPQDGTRFSRMSDPDDVSDGDIEAYLDREREYEAENGRESTMRDDGGEWRMDRIATIVAAGHQINEANEYAGRWAGDRVVMVGDYADGDLYSAMYGKVVAETESGDVVTWEGPRPKRQIPCRAGTDCCATPGRVEAHLPNEVADEGDTIKVRRSADSDDDFATLAGYHESEWTNITDGLFEELRAFTGDQFFEDGDSIMRPDMVLQG